MILFLFVFSLMIFSAHFYLWLRLIYNVIPMGTARYIGTVVLILLGLSTILGLVLSHFLPLKRQEPLAYVAYTWMGMALFLTLTLLIIDIISLAINHLTPLNIASYTYWPLLRATLSLLITTVLSAIGINRAVGEPEIVKYDVHLANLPKEFDGFTIVQLSDLHVAAVLEHNWLKKRVADTMALKPDLIAITGDLTDGMPKLVQNELLPLKELKAPFGTYFVTGNHEYISDAVGWVNFLPQVGLRVLRNEHLPLTKDGATIYLAGVDDHDSAGRAPGHGQDVSRATAGIPLGATIICLAHQPKTVEEAKNYGVSLLLAGHTHGGQLWPWTIMVKKAQKYFKGLYRVGNTQLIVSQGTGFWGPPMRIGSQSEILLITLHQ